MARTPGATRRCPRPPLSVVVALSLVCWLIASASAPAATSNKAPVQVAPPAHTDASVPSRPESGAARKLHERPATAGPESAAPPAPTALPRSGGQGNGEPSRPRPPASSEERQRLAREREARRANRRAAAPRPPVAAAETPGEGAAGAEPGLATVAGPAAARREKGKKGKAKEPKHVRKVERPVDPPHATAAVPVAIASSVVAPAAPVASAATVSAPVSAPVIVTQKPSASSSGSLAARSSRTPAAGRTAAGSPLTTAGLAPAATPTVPATAKRKPAAGSRRPSARRSQSPLVTTVTKIINVVPLAVRIVIGALVALALALAASSRVAALRARRLARQRRELLDDVGLLQAALLPALPGRLGPVGTSAAYRPASGPGAGGDFYDVFALGDGQLAVIVGDVSGHGRAALPHTTLLRFTLRAYLEAGLSPRNALQAAAPVLERQLGNSLATVVLATYDPRERTLVYACAGHPPPLVLGTESITPILACSAPPIGAGQLAGTRQTVVSVPGGALACFYTDGVIEARVGEELFGASRLERTLAGLDPGNNASALLDRVAEECDRRPDDMAACLLRIEGAPAAPIVQVEELELDRHEAAGERARRFLLAGGVEPDEIGEVLHEVHGAVARHGGVVLELHLAEGAPRVVLRLQNLAMLYPPGRARSEILG
jgi:serine phosphatase RsbU (regulator of sigma subunit)